MAVQVLITDRKVYNQYANDNDYSTNPGTYTTYLRGGVMASQKAVYTVEVAFAEAWLGDTTGNSWTVENNVLTRNQGSFINEGFSIGDTIDLSLGIPLVSVFTDRIITNITDDKIFFDGSAVALINSVDGGYLDGGKTDLFGLEYSFGIINNTDQAEYRSLLDNSEQTFYAADIGIDSGGGRDTGFVTLLEKSNYNIGWNGSQIGKSRVRFVSRPSTYIQQFIIEHEYVINPYNNENLLNQNKSFKYVSKFDFRTNLANLNTSKINEDDLQLGAVGWFNENYDGYNNDFTVSNLVYTDVATASTVTELNIKSRTKIEFTVNSASGYFTNGE